MAEKQSNKERIKEITAGIEKGIQELFESDRYRNYLTTMSRFHRYSLNNVMLIHAQKPDATLVAGFNKWKNSFGRHVKKGEKGIQILAPTPYKIKQEEQKLDPDTKLPLLDENGEPVTEEKEVTIPMFKVVSVFDVSQTDGKPNTRYFWKPCTAPPPCRSLFRLWSRGWTVILPPRSRKSFCERA